MFKFANYMFLIALYIQYRIGSKKYGNMGIVI